MTRAFLFLLLAASVPLADAQIWAASSNAKRIQGIPICTDAPADTNALVYVAASGCWKPGAGGGSGSVPSTSGKNYAIGQVDSLGNMVWDWKLAPPVSGTQSITAAGNTISCDRLNVALSSDAERTLTSTPTIVDGSDGQICRIANVGTNTLFLRKHVTTTAESNIADDIRLQPNESVTLTFVSSLSLWVPDRGSWVEWRYYPVASHMQNGGVYTTAPWTAPTTNGPATAAVGTAATWGLAGLNYAETALRYAHLNLELPSDYVGIANPVKLVWIPGATCGATPQVDWGIETAVMNADGLYTSAIAADAIVTVTATINPTTANSRQTTNFTLAPSAWAKSTLGILRVSRNASAAANDDPADCAAYFLGAEVGIRRYR